MAEVYVTDVPGGDYQAYQCPNCSRYHPAVEIDDQGLPKLELDNQGLVKITVKPPSNCRRCQSPMDIEESKAFQEEYTRIGNQPGRPATRQTVTM